MLHNNKPPAIAVYSQYKAYLLRLWKEKPDSPSSWRASLQHISTHEQCVLAQLELLFAYLQGESEQDEDDQIDGFYEG